jgi:SAM-dependent methyltransferase
MEEIPEDRLARLAFLEKWAVEQRRGRRAKRWLDVGATWSVRVWSRLVLMVERKVERKVEQLDRVFDRGLDTSDAVMHIPEIQANDGQHYEPSPWYILPRALRAVGASDRDVLVDFGCGKGRIVHQAAKRPLKRVIGVEISPELAAFAQTLVAAHRHEYRCQNVEIFVCDAARFHVPDDVTIAYLFFPFRGTTLDAVLHNLIESIDRRPRRMHVIYAWPTQNEQVLATGRFRLVRETNFLRMLLPARAGRHRTAIFESCS